MTEKSKSESEHWADLFMDEFEQESDRACAILAASMLENVLDVILRSKLVAIATQHDPLFDGAFSPMASFSAKIEMMHRLGILHARITRELHLIRRIRNEFAHNITGCDFEDASVRSRIIELSNSEECHLISSDVRDAFVSGPKGDFQMIVSWILWYLWNLAKIISPIVPPSEAKTMGGL